MIRSEITFGAAAPLPAAGSALVAGSQMSVRVEEEEMYLKLTFQGSVLGGGPGIQTLGFLVDSVAAPTLPLLSFTFLATEAIPVNISHVVKLTKGEHKVGLLGNDPTSAGHTIDGAVVQSVFSATRYTDDATLAHGVDSKVQQIF